jgi:hypothetical protein
MASNILILLAYQPEGLIVTAVLAMLLAASIPLSQALGFQGVRGIAVAIGITLGTFGALVVFLHYDEIAKWFRREPRPQRREDDDRHTEHKWP